MSKVRARSAESKRAQRARRAARRVLIDLLEPDDEDTWRAAQQYELDFDQLRKVRALGEVLGGIAAGWLKLNSALEKAHELFFAAGVQAKRAHALDNVEHALKLVHVRRKDPKTVAPELIGVLARSDARFAQLDLQRVLALLRDARPKGSGPEGGKGNIRAAMLAARLSILVGAFGDAAEPNEPEAKACDRIKRSFLIAKSKTDAPNRKDRS